MTDERRPAKSGDVKDAASPRNWEAEVLRRIAPRVEEVQRRMARENDDESLGWEAAGLKRLAQVTGGER